MYCKDCELSKTAKQPVPGLGPAHSQLMIIGRNPGRDEDTEGLPFVGGAGKVLNALLHDAGIKRSKCYVTNVVKCYTPMNREPEPGEIKCCLKYLLKEIQTQHPNCILALGDLAMEVLTQQVGITKWRGSVLTALSPFPAIKVIPTFHPSYIMRGSSEFWTTVVRDMKLALAQSEFAEIRKQPTAYYIAEDLPDSQLAEIYEQLMNPENYISFDIETPGTLQPWKGGILGIAFGYAEGCSICFDMRVLQSQEMVKDILAGPARKVVQRGTFDCFYLKYHGYEVVNLWFDTKVAQHMVAPILPNDLAYLASVHTDVSYYKPGGKGGGVCTMTREELAEYNNTDGDVTRRVVAPLYSELLENGQWSLFQRNMRLIPAISDMQLRGVKVDLEAVQRELAGMVDFLDGTEKLFLSKGINIRSRAQVGELLSSLGLPLKRTASGKQFKVDKDVLKQLNHPVAKRLANFYELDKLRGTFLEGIQTHLVNGRVHSTYSITGTLTGRLSSRDPNLQNIPKRVRNIYIPDNELFVEGDYNQFELKVIAAVTNDRQLQEDLDSGMSIHMNICREVYGKDEISDKELLRGKAVVFGTCYGRSPKSIAQEFGITIAEATRIQNVVVGKYPKLASYKLAMEGQKMVRSVFGRIKLFDGKITELYNFPIQSAAADIMLGALIELHDRLPKELDPSVQLVLTVYDSILVDTPGYLLEQTVQLMKEVMERPIPELNGKRFTCKFKKGLNWRDLEVI